MPVFLHTIFKDNPFYHGIRTIMTIHNLRFQGIWDIPTLKLYTGLPDWVFTPDRMEYKKDANMLKGGLVFADRITTVSETYAGEIQCAFYGEGLDGLLRAKSNDLSGIVNGIDYDLYNPATDQDIEHSTRSATTSRARPPTRPPCKRSSACPRTRTPCFLAMVTRLTDQKGLDLVNWIIGRLVESRIQFVVVGTGDPRYEGLFRHMQEVEPDKVRAYIAFNEGFAHKVYAGADAMLMPSLFEPCGLTQLISLRYGTL